MSENYSYKDPSCFIKIEKERVLRFITNLGKDDYELIKNHKIVNGLIKKRKKNITPMVIDLMNPNADIGFNNEEKFSFLSRIRKKIDFVLALAIIHHFVFQNNVSLTQALKMIINLGKIRYC